MCENDLERNFFLAKRLMQYVLEDDELLDLINNRTVYHKVISYCKLKDLDICSVITKGDKVFIVWG